MTSHIHQLSLTFKRILYKKKINDIVLTALIENKLINSITISKQIRRALALIICFINTVIQLTRLFPINIVNATSLFPG